MPSSWLWIGGSRLEKGSGAELVRVKGPRERCDGGLLLEVYGIGLIMLVISPIVVTAVLSNPPS